MVNGNNFSPSAVIFEAYLAPCDAKHPQCGNYTQTQMNKYIETNKGSWVMWYNRVTFSVDTYVGEPFLKFSTIEKVYISTNIPNYLNFNIQTTVIDD